MAKDFKLKLKQALQDICMEKNRTISDVINCVNKMRPENSPILNFSCLTFTKVEQLAEIASALGMSVSEFVGRAEKNHIKS